MYDASSLYGVLPEGELETVLDQYQRILKAAGCSIFTLDQKGHFVSVSKSIEQLTGDRADELIGKPFIELIPQHWRRYVQNAQEDGIVQNLQELPLRTVDGTFCWVRYTVIPLADEHEDNRHYYQCMVQDITQQRDLANELMLRNRAIEASATAIVIADARSGDLPIIYINPGFEEITGYDLLDSLGRNCRFLQGTDRDQPQIATMRQAIAEQREVTVTLRNYRKNGEMFWNEVSLSPVFDERGELTHYIGISKDVTTQKKAEQELAQERNLLRTLIDALPDAIHVKDTQGVYILSNTMHASVLGAASPHDVVNKTGYDLLPSEIAATFEEEDRHVITTGQSIEGTERRAPARSQNMRWFKGSKVPLRDTDGNITGVIGIASDITQQKEQGQELQRREQLYRMLVRNLPGTAVFLFDHDLRLLAAEGEEIDPALSDSQGNILITDVLSSDRAQDDIESVYAPALQGRHVRVERQYDGVYYELQALPLRNAAGKIYSAMVLARNIDEQKRYEQALRSSEARNRALLGALPDMMFVIDDQGIYTEFHASDATQLIMPGSELIGRSIEAVGFSEKVAGEALLHLNLALDTGDIQTFEYELELEGQVHHFEARLVALNNREVLTLVRNITDLKRVQNELSLHIKDLEILRQVDLELAENLNLNYVCGLGLDAIMRLSNAQSGFMAIVEDDGALRVSSFVGEYDKQEIATMLNQKRGIIPRVLRHQEAELVMDVAKDPDYMPLLPDTQTMMILPLISHDRLVGVVNLEVRQLDRFDDERFQFARLLTGRIAAYLDNAYLYLRTQQQLEEITRLYEEVNRLDQLKTDMIRIASHDLKNPLAGIMGSLEMLGWDTSKSFSETEQSYLDNIKVSAKKMQRITQGILSLERIQQIADEEAYDTFDLRTLVQQSIRELAGDARNKAQTLSEMLVDTPVKVQGDPIQMNEAISNLISNAIKYTPEAGEIRIMLRVEDDIAKLRVIDTGYGIPEAQQKRLFTPFFRAKTNETKTIEGTGLGLHLVKGIIKRHGGEMYFVSKYGEGSTFGFDVPTFDGDDMVVTGSTIVG